MRPERYSYNYPHRSGSSRTLRARLFLAALALLAIVALVLAARGHPFAAHMRTRANDMVQPFMQAISIPAQRLREFMANKDAFFTTYAENKQLREENERLRHWQAIAQALKAENDNLRALAAYKPMEQADYITAQVIAQSPSAYSGSLLINAGSAQGLQSLQPVIDSYGLIGRLIEVGERSSRVLLLSDSSSRVPVISSKSRQHAILTGTGEELLRMNFIDGDAAKIELGETVMTTSEGGLIPDSVMIGTVFKRDSSGLLVKPLRSLGRAEYVRVMVPKTSASHNE